jgi:UDP-glucuronate decarboxylase
MSIEQVAHLLQRVGLAEKRILITGASGWLGRETLSLLRRVLDDDFSKVVTLSSSAAKAFTVGGENYVAKSMYDLETAGGFEVIIHLAFLTQDRLVEIGDENYSQRNRLITETISKICLHSQPEYLFLGSSGVADAATYQDLKSHSKRIYADLKSESEEDLTKLAEAQGFGIEIGRIWSVSGNQIKEPQKYALGDFILQAKFTGNIEIKSKSEVRRTYINAQEMMGIYLLRLLSGETGVMDSGGYKVTMEELARSVLAVLNPSGVIKTQRDSAAVEPDNYFPRNSDFNDYATTCQVQLLDIEEQIRITADSLAFRD